MRHAGALALLPLLAACAAAPSCPDGMRPARSEQLYFGSGRPHGPDVTQAEWDAFVREEIAPRFPQGFSLLEAQGHWRNADGSVADERSRVLQVLHPGDAAATQAVRDIAARYKARFDQEAVLSVQMPACMAL